MALSKKQKAKLAEALGKIGKGVVDAASKAPKKQQNGNLSGCGGCTTGKKGN